MEGKDRRQLSAQTSVFTRRLVDLEQSIRKLEPIDVAMLYYRGEVFLATDDDALPNPPTEQWLDELLGTVVPWLELLQESLMYKRSGS
jgi:hypothetical protein